MRRKKLFCIVPVALAIISVVGLVSRASAQTGWPDSNPCETYSTPSAASLDAKMLTANRMDRSNSMTRPDTTHGLQPEDWGLIVYDANQGVCWLADANLAGNPLIRALMGVSDINPDGTMDYATALLWVDALNRFDHGRGILGHHDWQLPSTPQFDSTNCSSSNNGTFGLLCSGSGLGNLYNVGLNRTFPDSVVPHFTSIVWPFRNLQPGLYWTTDTNSGGQVTFSFNTAISGSNTTKYNYFHVLPMTHEALGTPAPGPGVVPYVSGSGAGKAVYDTATGLSWTLDANLAASDTFGVSGNAVMGPTVSGTYLTAPIIDVDGTMLFANIDGSPGWLTAMNASKYAGTDKWKLPGLADLEALFQDMNITVGDTRLEANTSLGPFWNLQPSFYWACERDQSGNSQSPCDPSLYPSENPNGTVLEWSFNFDNGFEGTDFNTKEFYVMVYYPAPER